MTHLASRCRAPHLACTGAWSSAAASLAVGAIGASSRAALLAGLFLQAGVQVELALAIALGSKSSTVPLQHLRKLFIAKSHARAAMPAISTSKLGNSVQQHRNLHVGWIGSARYWAQVAAGCRLSG